MTICDAHVHFGWWNPAPGDSANRYYSAERTVRFLRRQGVGAFCFSVSSAQDPSWPQERLLDEYRAMLALAPKAAFPFYWLTDAAFARDPTLHTLLPEAIPWRGLKLHNEESDWFGRPEALWWVMAFAHERGLAVQFHTGGSRSDAGRYRDVCRMFPEVKIDLAHGRPVDEAIAIALECPNVFIDTSFMDESALLACAQEPALRGRMLFGSDVPAFYDYLEATPDEAYQARLDVIGRCFGAHAADVLTRNLFSFLSREGANDGLSCVLPRATRQRALPLTRQGAVRA